MEFLGALGDILEYLRKKDKQCIIQGDFNYNLLDLENKPTENLKDTSQSIL